MNYSKIILAFFLCLLFSCTNNLKQLPQTVTSITGQMPAIATDENMHIVYGNGDSLMYTFSVNKGESFTQPVLIDVVKDLVDFATRGPQIAAVKDGIVVIAVNKEGNVFSFIKDAHDQWLKTAIINDVDSSNKEGFLGLSSDGKNNLFAIWTDLRSNNHNKIYGAKSVDGGKTWSKNLMIYTSPDSSICECCKPSVVMHGNNIYVMFRNWLNGNRDMYLTQSFDGGDSFKSATKLGTENWKLNGCPMDGGGLAVDDNNVVQTVWRRQNKIYSSTVNTAEKEIGEGKSCSIESVNGKNIYSWVDDKGNIICLLPDDSKRIVGKGILPVLKSLNSTEVICAWQDGPNIKTSVLKVD